jgi:NAD(P) transhydrogenase subunit alpha
MEAVSPTLLNLIIFVLAIYVGYHVVWTVTPALHTPLMAVTNAISAIVIVGAMLAAALTETTLGKTMGVLAVALAAVNVFGGQFDSYVPAGSNVTVLERRTIVAVTAGAMLPLSPVGASSGGPRRQRKA